MRWIVASFLAAALIVAATIAGGTSPTGGSGVSQGAENGGVKLDAETIKRLTPMQRRVLCGRGTERAFTGALWNEHRPGTYYCAGCGAELFSSDAKYDSGSGWPSFFQPLAEGRIATRIDKSLGFPRIEILCAKCGGHLGHVFSDGPAPTGLRYCVNSAALTFVPR
ncbi:MAG: peptide-methionine (R)-S-oxide reductase MsrB [Candidatus Polarisedimenticolia bacterium]